MTKVIEENTLTGIADAIREKTGSTDKFKPSEMADAIKKIETNSQEDTLISLMTNTIAKVSSDKPTLIGGSLFQNCTSIREALFPNASAVWDYAFDGATNLEKVVVSDKVSIIRNATFRNCKNLSSFKIPSSVTSIADNSFINCNSLPVTELPSVLKTIGGYAFQNCYKFAVKKFPSSLTSIGNAGIRYCNGMAKVFLPSTLTSIATGNFTYCNGLTDIYTPHESRPSGWNSGAIDPAVTVHYGVTEEEFDEILKAGE